MAFKFKDLIVTLVPQEDGGSGGSGGGGGSGGSGGSGGTVGSCTSECGPGDRLGVVCGQSDEVLDPLKGLIDPPYLTELRLLLRLAVAKSFASKASALEAQMHPRTAQEVDKLEKQLKSALSELQEARKNLQNQK